MIHLDGPTSIPSKVDLQFVETSHTHPTCSSAISISSSIQSTANSLFNGDMNLSSSSAASVVIPSFLKSAQHPFVCLFHFLWKICAFSVYELGYFIFGHVLSGEGDFIFSFVITTVFFSLDFWTVKNITGRILVGMRWWNDIKEDGSSEWIFECAQDERTIDPTDSRVFWYVVYAWPFLWAILALLELIKFEFTWFVLCLIGFTLAFANFLGYWKCSKDQKRRMSDWASRTAFNAFISKWT